MGMKHLGILCSKYFSRAATEFYLKNPLPLWHSYPSTFSQRAWGRNPHWWSQRAECGSRTHPPSSSCSCSPQPAWEHSPHSSTLRTQPKQVRNTSEGTRPKQVRNTSAVGTTPKQLRNTSAVGTRPQQVRNTSVGTWTKQVRDPSAVGHDPNRLETLL